MTKEHATRTIAYTNMGSIVADNKIHVDFETRSVIDLRTRGGTMYAQHFSTAPLMLAAATNRGEAIYDFMGEDFTYAATSFPACKENDPRLNSYKPPIPADLAQAIELDYIFVAHNARFEQEI